MGIASVAPAVGDSAAFEKVGIAVKAIFIGGILAPRFALLNVGFINSAYFTECILIGYLKRMGIPQELLEDKAYIRFMRKTLAYDRMLR